MANREWVAVKSTLDKIVRDAVESQGLDQINVAAVDDVADFESVLKSREDAVLYQLVRLSPWPRSPKFEATFNIGAKTTDDGANFDMTRILGELNAVFQLGARFELRDYSGEEASERMGAMTLIDADVTPQQFDKQSGIRMLSCRAAVLCNGR